MSQPTLFDLPIAAPEPPDVDLDRLADYPDLELFVALEQARRHYNANPRARHSAEPHDRILRELWRRGHCLRSTPDARR